MATIKHLAIKNKSYAFPLRYLTYQYDEKTNKPILDENNHMVLRDEYLIDAIGVVSPSSFQEECEFWNNRNHKNQETNEIKLHHYIISFDPKDKEVGLTPEKVQAIGMEIAEKFFNGHQALVCTHPDGHNKSGNIHVHIVVNSVRRETIEKTDFIERESECKAGAKFRNSKLFLNSLRREVMDICEREKLTKVELLKEPTERISEKEYRKKQREQNKLDTQNAEMEKDGVVPAKTEFLTEKDKIRKAIKKAIHKAKDEAQFKKYLEAEGITVTESRGRWGFKTADMKKPIRARQFGTNYEREYILNELGSIKAIRSTDNYFGSLKRKVDVQNAISAANTMNFFVKNQLTGAEDLRAKLNAAEQEYSKILSQKSEILEKLNYTNLMIHNTGSYLANRKYYNAWKQLPVDQREAYETKFAAELANYKKANEAIRADMKDHGIMSMRKLEDLKADKEALMGRLEHVEAEAAKGRQTRDELNILLSNYNKLLDLEPKHEQQSKKAVRNMEAR